jgi:hypothetical protein
MDCPDCDHLNLSGRAPSLGYHPGLIVRAPGTQRSEPDTDADEGGAMPQGAWSKKRERQYEHIRDGLEDRGTDEDLAKEIAARTVNKDRARAGEAD